MKLRAERRERQKRHVKREKEKEKSSEITCTKKRKAKGTRKVRKREGEIKRNYVRKEEKGKRDT